MNLLIGLAVLALLVYRQLQVGPVRANFRLPLILAVIGVIELTSSSSTTAIATPSSPRSRAA